jgi:hypothetical protein
MKEINRPCPILPFEEERRAEVDVAKVPPDELAEAVLRAALDPFGAGGGVERRVCGGI